MDEQDVDKEFSKLVKGFGEVPKPELVISLQEFSNLASHFNDVASALTSYITLALEDETFLENTKLDDSAPGIFDAAIALAHSIMGMVHNIIEGYFTCPECEDEECDCQEDEEEDDD